MKKSVDRVVQPDNRVRNDGKMNIFRKDVKIDLEKLGDEEALVRGPESNAKNVDDGKESIIHNLSPVLLETKSEKRK